MQLRVAAVTRSLVPFLLIFVIWWSVTHVYEIPRAYLPKPEEVWQALEDNVRSGVLLEYLTISLRRLFLGFAIGSSIGLLLGFIFGMISNLGRFFRPLVQFFNSISGITWLPIVIIWLGIGEPVIIFVIVNVVLFLVLLNTMLGVQSVPKVYENALYTLGASKARIISDVIVPGSLPYVLTGLRVGFGMSWRALIAGEIVASSAGLGYQIYIASSYFKQEVVVMGILIVGTLAAILDFILFEPIETMTVRRWGLVTEHA